MSDARLAQLAKFEEIGVSEVRRMLALRAYGDDSARMAYEWISGKEAEAAARDRAAALASSEAANALAARANSVAEEANLLASEANRTSRRNMIATSASAVIAAVALIVAIAALFKKSDTPPPGDEHGKNLQAPAQPAAG